MGQLLRIIILLIGLWLVLQIIKRALGTRRSPPPRQASIAKMVACTYCGTHVPESETIRDGDKTYCCEDHREKSRAH
ncbi:MAG: PP0621 family protein [Sulfuricaulis sp.]